MTIEVAEAVRLYPAAAPGSEGWTHHERETVDPATGTRMIVDVVVPTVTPVLPPVETRNGSSVVVAPGGAFTALAWDHEGMPMARWLAERGVAAFVLKYRLARVPTDLTDLVAEIGPMPDAADMAAVLAWGRKALGNAPEIATADGEQAIRTVRADADTWGLDPTRVGVLGFSAGGTVAARTGATTDATARPSFVANIYGAFFEREVPADAPPYFGVVAADDALSLDSSVTTARAWLDAGRQAELHVYERGGHGFALRSQGAPVDGWTDRLADWLATRGVLRATGQDSSLHDSGRGERAAQPAWSAGRWAGTC